MQKRNVAGPVFGFLTLIFCFVWIASLFLKAWVVFWIGLFLCLVSLGIFAGLRYKEFVNFFVSRQLRYATNVALSILGVIGIAVFVNIIVAQRFDKRVDLTELRINSLSEQTKKILKDLNKNVEVIAFFRNSNTRKLQAEHWLKLYQYETKFITVSFKDPDIENTLVEKYGIELDGTTVFDDGKRSEKVTVVDEQKFTSALLKIIQNRTKKVYFLTGHRERRIDDLTNNGYNQVKTELEKQNYAVHSLPLLKQDGIPTDCDALVIAGPKKPLMPQEIQKIEKYLKENGKLLLLLDPTLNSTEDVNHRLVQLMKKWGVKVGNDLVYDQVNFYLFGGNVALDLRFEPHEITRYFFRESIPFISCRSISPIDNKQNNISVQSIAKTKSRNGISWAETEREVDGTFSNNGYTAGVDTPGPVSIAVAVEHKNNENTVNKETSTPTSTRIIVFGDSDFAKDGLFATGNPDIPAYAPIFVSIINWLILDEDLIAIVRPDSKSQVLRKMNDHQVHLVKITSVFLIPVIVFIAGIVVWWLRREGGTA